METKICSRCREEKCLSEFYVDRHSGLPVNPCIVCKKANAHNQKNVDDKISTVESERWVIERLARVGIHALPGKALSHYYCDVVAWGCVGIEVKSSSFHLDDGHEYFHFGFTHKQKSRGILGQVVVLVCRDVGYNTFHVFPATHPMFYNDDGNLKRAVTYTPMRSKSGKPSALTDEMMDEAEDRWELVEEVRQQIRRRLMPPLFGDLDLTP